VTIFFSIQQESDGWYQVEALDVIRAVLRKKFLALQNNEEVSDMDCQSLLEKWPPYTNQRSAAPVLEDTSKTTSVDDRGSQDSSESEDEIRDSLVPNRSAGREGSQAVGAGRERRRRTLGGKTGKARPKARDPQAEIARVSADLILTRKQADNLPPVASH
jgi:hypothetical protein